MRAKKTYVSLLKPLLFLLAALLLGQLWKLGKEEKAERQVWSVTGEVLSESIEEDTLLEMKKFPGLEKL